jgi:hypothetical protein
MVYVLNVVVVFAARKNSVFYCQFKMLFGFVAAGEFHPQPHILMFGK